MDERGRTKLVSRGARLDEWGAPPGWVIEAGPAPTVKSIFSSQGARYPKWVELKKHYPISLRVDSKWEDSLQWARNLAREHEGCGDHPLMKAARL
jgi:hypothetical protein